MAIPSWIHHRPLTLWPQVHHKARGQAANVRKKYGLYSRLLARKTKNTTASNPNTATTARTCGVSCRKKCGRMCASKDSFADRSVIDQITRQTNSLAACCAQQLCVGICNRQAWTTLQVRHTIGNGPHQSEQFSQTVCAVLCFQTSRFGHFPQFSLFPLNFPLTLPIIFPILFSPTPQMYFPGNHCCSQKGFCFD